MKKFGALFFAFVSLLALAGAKSDEELRNADVNAALTGHADPEDAESSDKKEVEESAAPKISPLDWEWEKSQVLENLLNRKLIRLVEGSGVNASKFRSNVVVLFNRIDPPKKTEKKEKAPPPQSPLAPIETLDFPELRANPMDLQGLMNTFQASSSAEDAMYDGIFNRKPGSLPPMFHVPNESEVRYVVSRVSMDVSVDPMVGEERAKALQAYIQAAFAPSFGDRLAVQVRAVPLLAPDFPAVSLWDRLEKFQRLALALLAASLLLMLALIWKLIPTRRRAHQFKFEHKRHDIDETISPKAEEEENEEMPGEETKDDAAAFVPGGVAFDPKESVPEALSRMERQIIQLVRSSPSLTRVVIQDFATQTSEDDGKEQDRSMLALSLLLETLAKYQISAEKFNVKPTLLRKFQEMRSQIAKIEPADRLTMLQEVYWMLVSFSFLSEGESSFPAFYFLESLTEGQIVRLISDEQPICQATVLLGISEKKSARVLNRMPFQTRGRLFELMCSGQSMDGTTMQALVQRMKTKASSIGSLESIPSTAKEGVEVIAQMISKLDFKSEFDSVRSLFSTAPDLRTMLKGELFFSALLSEAKPEFLAKVFVDRRTDWIVAATAPFGELFRAQVSELLPDMQKRMLASSMAPVSPAASLKVLEELQKETRAKIEAKQLSLSEVFDLDGKSGTNGFATAA